MRSFVASQRLHRRVVDNFHRPAAKGHFEVKANPSMRQVVRLAERAGMDDGSRIADGHRIILPTLRGGSHRGDQLCGSNAWPGQFQPLLVAGGRTFIWVPPTSTTRIFIVES